MDAQGTAMEPAIRRAARVAGSWLRAVPHDLSPFGTPGRALPPASARQRLAAWSGVLLVLGLGTLDLYQHYRLSPAAALALGAARALPLALCLARPLAAWWLELAAVALTALVSHPISSAEPWPWAVTSAFAVIVLLVAAGRVAPRRVLVELWLVLGLVSAAALLAVPGRGDWGAAARTMALFAGAAVLADAVRGRNEARRRLVEEEQVSEAERARRALLEERARIARELHDVVAHRMSLIAIQAEAAPYRVPDAPEELTASFASIRANAVDGLTELRRVLGLLRAEGDGGEASPQPSLEGIGELAAGVRGAGLSVETSLSGTPRPLPPAVEVSAYRIVQEALSNAVRHAPGSDVRVEIAYAPAGLRLRVVNGPPRTAATEVPGHGHGVLGMRERAAMLGGELTAGPTADGGYAVAAVLPATGGGDR